jgi:hypothetical protein
MGLPDVVAHDTRRKAHIPEPAILIRINRLYRYGMTPAELSDATSPISGSRSGSRFENDTVALALGAPLSL